MQEPDENRGPSRGEQPASYFVSAPCDNKPVYKCVLRFRIENELARPLLGFIVENPGYTRTEIHRALRLSKNNLKDRRKITRIGECLDDLMFARLIEKKGLGHHATPRGIAALAEVR